MATIVILDDSAINRSIYAKLVTMVADGMVTESFSQPLDALEWLEHNTADLIITDFSMPQMDGASFTERVRALPALARTPVLVVTAYDDRSFRVRALDAGATDFLQSPIDHFEFVTRVRNLLALSPRLTGEGEPDLEPPRLLPPVDALTLALVLDLVPALISITNRAGVYLYANARFAASLGLTPAEVSGRHVLTLLGPERGAASQAQDQRICERAEAVPPYTEAWPPTAAAGAGLVHTSKMPLPDPSGAVMAVLTTSWPLLEAAVPPAAQAGL